MTDISQIVFKNLVMGTNPENMGEITGAVNKFLNRSVIYRTTHHAMSGLVDIDADVSDKEYDTICQSGILVDILYRKEK